MSYCRQQNAASEGVSGTCLHFWEGVRCEYKMQLCSVYLPCPRCMHLTQVMYRQIVFVPGGHGIAFDGPGNKKLASVLTEAYSSGIAIVSHFCWLSCKAEKRIYCMGYTS